MTIRTNLEQPLTSEYHVTLAQGAADSPLLVFIPGNPGLIDYYTTYLDLISVEYPDHDILAISHAGFQTSGDFVADAAAQKYVFYDLEYQIRHKCSIIKKYIAQGHTRLSFLCHSVGGYITQRVVARLLADKNVGPKISIEFIGLVCPTIVDIAKSDSGVFFTKLFTYLPLIQLAVWFLVVLQTIFLDSLARKIISKLVIARPQATCDKLKEAWQNSIRATFKIYKSKRITRQTLELAREELQVIHRDDDINDWFFNELPASHGTRLWCFFAASDYWVHDNLRDYILGRYHDQDNLHVRFQIGEPSTKSTPAITHSFCIDQSVEFAEITCAALRFKA
ncbi:hypothetical protein METBIDRAFT_14033 [Metschnikowia bicuspidata var. bicuspidata NRRL YB-4993]|uniref:DUF676 domain-containing protein n=1 Tax=Metschnikowia bicuspidata var. bicuspidata NRRL YB-4993 TaxID=869754 RepID=A0A1A0GYX6_9ASCO|nr:hypothetical protein METBIDRAFT_14033 [Metschnikowia bicuspidata var. bicuspidata NRRL YB-4993]OBA16956.1 hypothetical protein METBIDRAFT_14033 [Metschnikowia bicuspidata var. bicuspidata NRRL YB-4993]